VFPSRCHGARHVTIILPSTGFPVLVFDGLVADPEPQVQSAGVAQSHPDVAASGCLGDLLDRRLILSVGDGDQFRPVLSAVGQGPLPGHGVVDQDQFICRHGDKHRIIPAAVIVFFKSHVCMRRCHVATATQKGQTNLLQLLVRWRRERRRQRCLGLNKQNTENLCWS